MTNQQSAEFPHRRKNILTGDWVLVSPERSQRPWQGEVASVQPEAGPAYDAHCYLCPGNKRASGEVNPSYQNTFVFPNDFPALTENVTSGKTTKTDFLTKRPEKGICRVVCFSPRHDTTLAEMPESEIELVIAALKDEFGRLGADTRIKCVQIFENKGLMMGTSNPHPHGQIWAQESLPTEVSKEAKQFKGYFTTKKRSLLSDYLKEELKQRERIVYENSSFLVVVPFWAVWPYETMVVPKRKMATILELDKQDTKDFANAISALTIKYDNLFNSSFPYSAGIHQAPTDGKSHKEWHFHMHFYPPLLRSASVRKFMVGYEMLAEPQRDLTPESSAKTLRDLPMVHYKVKNKT